MLILNVTAKVKIVDEIRYRP